MGKGDNVRPRRVTYDEYQRRWDRAFGGDQEKTAPEKSEPDAGAEPAASTE